MTQNVTTIPAPTPDIERDRFGNRILVRGPQGQLHIQSARDGRMLSVCAEASTPRHLPFWEYDPDERRLVCAVCFPKAQRTPETSDPTEPTEG